MLLRAAAPGSCETISVSDGARGRLLRARRLNAALRALTFSSSFAHRASIKLGLRVRKFARNTLGQGYTNRYNLANYFFNNLVRQRPLLRDNGVQQTLTFSQDETWA